MLIAAAFTLVAGIAAAAWVFRSQPPLQLAWAPVQDPEVLERELQPLTDYLSEQLGRPIELVVTESYQDSADRLIVGHAPFAVLPPYIYVLTKQREPRIRPLTNQLWDGVGSADAFLIVRAEDAPDDLEELRNKPWCFVEKASTTGALLPRAYLKSRGHDPDEFISEIVWSGSHQDVLKDLVAGKCIAAATYDGNVETASKYGVDTEQLEVFASTGKTPNEAIVAGPDVDPALATALQAALLAFDPPKHLGRPYLGESQHITGFELPDEDAFDAIWRGVQDEPGQFRPW